MRLDDDQHVRRVATYSAVANRLALTSDGRLAGMVAAAEPLGYGIGGRSSILDLDGTLVFVKRVPLTDIEALPVHALSTVNLFGLPTYYQYGVGSAGFGAWRELAAHVMTTDWVLGHEYGGFPLLYHWRVLPDSAPEGVAEEFGGVDAAVAYWDGSPAVRERLEAIGRSSASLVLFLEHVPHTLSAWLGEQRDTDSWGTTVARVRDALAEGTDFLSARGFVHFDAHFRNVLTDGRQLYFADLGLALSSDFDLSAVETTFLSDHRAYDGWYTTSHLLRHHLFEGPRSDEEHKGFLREWIAGHRPDGIPAEVAAIISRHARTAVVLDSFHHGLVTGSKRTPFPAVEIARADADTVGSVSHG